MSNLGRQEIELTMAATSAKETEVRRLLDSLKESTVTAKGSYSVPRSITPSINEGCPDERTDANTRGVGAGVLIVNADDWGLDQLTTDRTLECVLRGAVSSVSAMVFMQDSERAAALARSQNIDAGLHLNFTTKFSASHCPARLLDHQRDIAAYLRGHRFAQVVFNPLLARSFEYVVASQLDEYCRLYGAPPERLDGHHHMHLCSNVLWGGLLPSGTAVRRNFSFQPGEKRLWNRLYRQISDRTLARRHRVTDFFFSLAPLEPMNRLQRVFSLARRYVVEVETHPANEAEYSFLAGGMIFQWAPRRA